LDAISGNYQVWVSGLMHTQNEHRKGLRLFEEKNGILKFYPILDIAPEERDMYILKHDLHFHPLVLEGYGSIGCTHCTVKGTGREGRWFGLAKTECGLHI
jgi:phosphoadenosine phosphosulfate reductase